MKKQILSSIELHGENFTAIIILQGESYSIFYKSFILWP